jgi:hypothetical protein
VFAFAWGLLSVDQGAEHQAGQDGQDTCSITSERRLPFHKAHETFPSCPFKGVACKLPIVIGSVTVSAIGLIGLVVAVDRSNSDNTGENVDGESSTARIQRPYGSSQRLPSQLNRQPAQTPRRRQFNRRNRPGTATDPLQVKSPRMSNNWDCNDISGCHQVTQL